MVELSRYTFKPTTIVRHYTSDRLSDICWMYEQGDLSYRQAVNEVKVQCALNVGLAEKMLFNQLSMRGKRLPMVTTRKIQEVIVRTERVQSVREEVETLFRQAKRRL